MALWDPKVKENIKTRQPASQMQAKGKLYENASISINPQNNAQNHK